MFSSYRGTEPYITYGKKSSATMWNKHGAFKINFPELEGFGGQW